MSTSHPILERRAEARRAHGRDGGFILATLGLLLIPLVAFTALAVDVSSWYSRATELQRAADSAALAGVVWMPDMGAAQSNGTLVLSRNNVTNGSAGLSVTMGAGLEQNSFKVCVTDNSAPQYFSSVFTGPQSLTRCGTAKYNLPLELGSPLNYYGGNASANVGTYPETTTTYSDSYTPPGGNYNIAPNNYASATVNLAYGGGKHGCKRQTGTRSGHPFGYLWSDSGARTYRDGNGSPRRYLDNFAVWRYPAPSGTQYYADDLPDCLWTITNTTTVNKPINPIPNEKSPNFWAAIAGPGMFAPNGDAKAPRCKSSGNCGTTDNSMYRWQGYWYAVVPSVSGTTSVQLFDADQSSTSTVATGDTRYGGSTNQHTQYLLYDSQATPYDQSDDTVVPGCSLTVAGLDDAYKMKWVQLCNPNLVGGHRYYLNVRSSNADGGWDGDGNGNTYNGYAVRVVGGTFPADCLSSTFPQRNNVDCYGTGAQPRISGYGDMEMYNGIPSGTPTQFFLAEVKNEYRGKTLVIELWDPGDGNGNSYITVMKPGGTAAGDPQQGCEYEGRTAAGTRDSGPNNPTGDCTIQTTTSGSNTYQNRWVHIEINLPSTYSCNESVADPTTTGGSCWWQIKYNTSSSLNDYTTWTAFIQGDPVRLVR